MTMKAKALFGFLGLTTTPPVLNYKLFWFFGTSIFAMYLDIIIIYLDT
jgi:hypothetical protein